MNRRLPVTVANRFCSRVIANSAATANAFIREGGNPRLVGVVPNGISSMPFSQNSAEDIAALRRELGWRARSSPACSAVWPPGRASSLHPRRCGRPGSSRRHRRRRPVGEEDYEAALKRLCVELGIAGRVHFLGFRRDIPRLMRMMDVIVHASTAPEPFGRVLVEAMLASTPLIASRAGGALEIVQDGVTAALSHRTMWRSCAMP